MLTDQGAVYPVRVLFAVRDSLTRATTSMTQTHYFAAARLVESGRYIRTLMQLNAAPSLRGEYRLRIENGGAASQGQVQSGQLAIRDYGGAALQLSDIVVAEVEGGRLQRGATTLSPIPTHQVEIGATFRLFYEIYNMPEDAPYRTTIRIVPATATGMMDRIRGVLGRRRSIELSFSERATRSEGKHGLQQMRTIGAELQPDRYILVLTVERLDSGERVEHATSLIIIPR